MAFKDDLKAEISSIFRGKWTTETAQKVPAPEDLRLKDNHGKRLSDAVVLYADIDGSTTMVDTYSDTFSAEVYKAYLYSAAQVINRNSGSITAYDGDRVMAVFFEDTTKNTNAVSAALQLNYVVEELIRPAYAFYSNGFTLRHVVGVDRSDLLAARTGVRGYNDIVWVGRAANYAAKYCAYNDATVWIAKCVYDMIHDSVKYDTGAPLGVNMWTARYKAIGTKVVELFSTSYRKSP